MKKKNPWFSIFMLQKSWNRNPERSMGKGDFIFVGTRGRLSKHMGQGEGAVKTLVKVQGINFKFHVRGNMFQKWRRNKDILRWANLEDTSEIKSYSPEGREIVNLYFKKSMLGEGKWR